MEGAAAEAAVAAGTDVGREAAAERFERPVAVRCDFISAG